MLLLGYFAGRPLVLTSGVWSLGTNTVQGEVGASPSGIRHDLDAHEKEWIEAEKVVTG